MNHPRVNDSQIHDISITSPFGPVGVDSYKGEGSLLPRHLSSEFPLHSCPHTTRHPAVFSLICLLRFCNSFILPILLNWAIFHIIYDIIIYQFAHKISYFYQSPCQYSKNPKEFDDVPLNLKNWAAATQVLTRSVTGNLGVSRRTTTYLFISPLCLPRPAKAPRWTTDEHNLVRQFYHCEHTPLIPSLRALSSILTL